MELKRQLLLSVVTCGYLVDAYSVCLADHSLATDSILFSELKEITVMADRRAMKLRSDKIIYDPSATVSGGQGNAYEAIKAIPGITVRSSGDISFNGIQSVAVSFDGRKTILNGENLLNFLKSLPVKDIENIEIINSAGAKSDGSDPTTMLNLVRRRKKDDCYSIGANSDGQIWKARQIYSSVFGEYSRNGHCISVNYSHYVARNPSELLTDRPYLDFKERLTQVYDRRRRDSSQFLSLSYEYRLSEGFVVGTSINYNHFKRKEPAVMTTSVPFVTDQTVTSNNALFVTDNVIGEIYFRSNPSKQNTVWVVACDYFRYRSSESQFMEDNTGRSINGVMEGKTYGIVGSFDFNRSISSYWRLSFGTRFSYVDMNSEGSYTGHTSNESVSNSLGIDNLDSSFGYNENVNALYAEGKCSYGILNASVGLRGEQSNLNTYFSGNESAESRDLSKRYFHIYPSLSFMLSTSAIGSYMLAYADKVTRPRFSDLDPFIHLYDNITHVGGNINLKEAHRQSLNLIWSDNGHWRVMVAGEIVSNEIVKYYRELSDRIVYVTPENIPLHMQLLISATGSDLGITSWWKLSATANLIYSTYRFAKDTGLNPNSLWTPMLELKNVFRLPYQIMAEVDASFRGRMAFGQAQISHVWNTYAGVRKSFCNDRLSISLYVKDIFNSNNFNSTILLSGRNALLYEKEYEDMRKIGISATWIFSGGTGNSKKESRNICVDELNRITL